MIELLEPGCPFNEELDEIAAVELGGVCPSCLGSGEGEQLDVDEFATCPRCHGKGAL